MLCMYACAASNRVSVCVTVCMCLQKFLFICKIRGDVKDESGRRKGEGGRGRKGREGG